MSVATINIVEFGGGSGDDADGRGSGGGGGGGVGAWDVDVLGPILSIDDSKARHGESAGKVLEVEVGILKSELYTHFAGYI